MQSDDQKVEHFDRERGKLIGLPGVTHTRAATVQHSDLTRSETYIVQTVRLRDEDNPKAPPKDRIFLEFIGPSDERPYRLVLPHGVAEVIARQRDQLATISRKRAARSVVAAKRAAGVPLGNPEALKRARKARKRRAR